MKIIPFYFYNGECNTYAVTEDGRDCILIDCGSPAVYGECIAVGLTPRAVLLTHGHLDHIAGCETLSKNGAQICCGEGEETFVFSDGNKSIFGVDLPDFKIDRTFKDGEKLKLCGLEIEVIKTAGHTVGGVSYLIGGTLFTGDTLFCGSIGRSDFPTGNFAELIESVKKLYAMNLPDDCKVYSGHGEPTTLGHERRFNAFVRA